MGYERQGLGGGIRNANSFAFGVAERRSPACDEMRSRELMALANGIHELPAMQAVGSVGSEVWSPERKRFFR